ncbi:MAG TPA: GNAT family protein [Burkholderiales bacterium]|nr:GNAT family protein [Burkholderiales bacterium]
MIRFNTIYKKGLIKTYLPKEILSDRVILRTIEEKYAQKINDAIRESNLELKKWVFWADPVPSIEETSYFCKQSYAKFESKTDLSMIIELKGSKYFVGCVGLHNFDIKGKNTYEVGYWGNLKYSGNGYMSEAVNALKEYAFKNLGAKKLYLTTDNKNIKSWRLAERCGFKLESIEKNERINSLGFNRDTRLYSISKTL